MGIGKIGLVLLFGILLVGFTGLVSADEEVEDLEIFGLDLEEVLILINAWLALFLFLVTWIAYRRDGRKRFVYISLGFFLFAVKSFMVSSELFFSEISWFDPVAVVLEFGALLSFFYGVLRR